MVSSSVCTVGSASGCCFCGRKAYNANHVQNGRLKLLEYSRVPLREPHSQGQQPTANEPNDPIDPSHTSSTPHRDAECDPIDEGIVPNPDQEGRQLEPSAFCKGFAVPALSQRHDDAELRPLRR